MTLQIVATEWVDELGAWADVNRLTCDFCGASETGIDVPFVGCEKWQRLAGPELNLDECPACIAGGVPPTPNPGKDPP